MNLHVTGLTIKNIFGNPGLADIENELFKAVFRPIWAQNTKSNFSSETLDHFSFAKSAQHEVQTNKKKNKQTEYQNLKVWEYVFNVWYAHNSLWFHRNPRIYLSNHALHQISSILVIFIHSIDSPPFYWLPIPTHIAMIGINVWIDF